MFPGIVEGNLNVLCSQVELLNPQPGYFEIEPEGLWRKIIKVITESIRSKCLVLLHDKLESNSNL